MITKAELKHIRSLHRSKGRYKYNQFMIEGRRIFQEALQVNELLHVVYFTSAFKEVHPGIVEKIINKCPAAQEISQAEMKTMSATETPSGILGVCAIPDPLTLADRTEENWLFLDNISDPGNMGTLLRTAAWFGVNNISIAKDCVDIYNPKVVRGGMGVHFNITCLFNADIKQFTATHSIVGADHKGKPLSEYEITAPWVLVLGSEARGISKSVRDNIHQFLAIPRIGTGESLNVAVAGGILLDKLTADN